LGKGAGPTGRGGSFQPSLPKKKGDFPCIAERKSSARRQMALRGEREKKGRREEPYTSKPKRNELVGYRSAGGEKGVRVQGKALREKKRGSGCPLKNVPQWKKKKRKAFWHKGHLKKCDPMSIAVKKAKYPEKKAFPGFN